MNNTYKVVWNASLGAWNVASEIAGSRGKTKSSKAVRAYVLASIVGVSALTGALNTANAAVSQTLNEYYYAFMGYNPVFLNHKENIAYMGQMAYGNYATVAKEYGITFGADSKSLGTSSSAFGHAANALADYSTAMGASSVASGVSSTAVGARNVVTSKFGVGLGADNSVNGLYSIGIGHQIGVTADRGIAMGTAAKVTGSDGISIGTNTEANQVGSIALGYQAKANHTNSIAIGKGSETTADNTVSFGKLGGTRLRLTNIEAAIGGTDAVNLVQMNSRLLNLDGAEITNIINKINNSTTTSIGLVQQAANKTITIAANKDGNIVSLKGIAGNRKISDLADGTSATDATNFKQLSDVKDLAQSAKDGLNGVAGKDGVNANVKSVADALNMAQDSTTLAYNQPTYTVGTTAAGNSVQSALDTVNGMVFGDSTNPTAPSISNNMTVLANALNVGVDQKGSFTAPEYTVNNKKATTVKAGFALVDEAINGVNGQNGLSANVASVADAVNMKKNAAGGYDQPAYKVGTTAAGNSVQSALDTVNSMVFGDPTNPGGSSISNNMTVLANALNVGVDQKGSFTAPEYTVNNKKATTVKAGFALVDEAINGVNGQNGLSANVASVADALNMKKNAAGGYDQPAYTIGGTAAGSTVQAALNKVHEQLGTINPNAVSYFDNTKTLIMLGGAAAPATIRNLKDGVDPTDAVNMAQYTALKTVVDANQNPVTNDINLKYLKVNGNALSASAASSGGGIAIGGNANASGAQSRGAVAIGMNTVATGANAVALGAGSIASAYTVSVGNTKEQRKITYVANGEDPFDAVNKSQLDIVTSKTRVLFNQLSDEVTAVSELASRAAFVTPFAAGLDGLFDGNKDSNVNAASAVGANVIALGGGSNAGADSATAIGTMATATGSSSTAIGDSANAESMLSTAVGAFANARGSKSLAMGMEAKAYGGSSIALGSNSKAINTSDIALGNATASGNYSFAVGDGAESTKVDAIAIGHLAKSTNDKSLAIGANTGASGLNTVALGVGAKAKADNSVALGSDSIASSVNSVSVGKSAVDNGGVAYLRSIENVKDGVNLTDVATYGQLKVVDAKIEKAANSIQYDDVSKTILTLQGVGGTTLDNLKKVDLNKDGKYAVTTGQAWELDQAIQQINGTIAPSDPTAPTLYKSVQYTDQNRTEVKLAGSGAKITNLIDGTATKDAVNFGQLEVVKSLAQSAKDGLNGADGQSGITAEVGKIAAALNMTKNSSGVFNAPSYAIAGNGNVSNIQDALSNLDTKIIATANNAVQYKDGTKTEINLAGSGAKITNLLDGTAAKDAVNKGQLDVVKSLAQSAKDGLNGADGKSGITAEVGKIAAALNMVSNGSGVFTAPEYKVNNQSANNVQSALNLLDAKITSASGDGVQYAAGSNKSIIQLAGVGGTTITNLKDSALAANGNGAVTTGQLFTTNTKVDALDTRTTTIEGNITNISNGTIGLVKQANSSSTITVASDKGGSEVNFLGNGQKRKLTGIADATISTGGSDAVTTGQLFTTNTKVDALDTRTTTIEGNITNISNGTIGLVKQVNSSSTITVASDKGGSEVSFLGNSQKRKLTGIADSTISAGGSDAVTTGQLSTTNTKVDALDTRVTNVDGRVTNIEGNINNGSLGLVKQTTANGTITVASDKGGSEVSFLGNSQKRKLTGIADSTINAGGSDAVTTGQLFTTNSAVSAVGNRVGDLESKVNDGSLGLVKQANTNSVITVAAATGGNEVSFLGSGQKRKLSGIADSTITTNGSDAATTGQLSTTNTRVETLEGVIGIGGGTGGPSIGDLARNSVQYDNATAKDKITLGKVGTQTTITNLKAGVADFDAVNMAQYNKLSSTVGNVQNESTGNINLRYMKVSGNSALDAYAGSKGVSIGGNARSANDGTAIGFNASAASNSVALGSGSVASAYTVSVGSSNIQRKITYVEAGESDFDAVNKKQLDLISNRSTSMFSKLSDEVTAVSQLASRALATPFAVELGGLFDGNKEATLDDASATGTNAVALGGNAVAGEESTIALGAFSSATGSSSTAIGTNSNAEAMLSTAIGAFANARASKSLAMGMEAKAYGGSSIALGSNSQALNTSDIAIGNATASGNYSFALGDSAESTKLDTLAIGHVAKSTGDKALAIGSNTAASSENTVALGAGAQATANGSVALGAKSVATTVNSISVGRAESSAGANDQILRTIENVKDGANATDVATFGQLEEVKKSVASGGKLGVGYTDDQFGTIVLRGSAVGGTTISGLKNGTGDSDAVNNAQLKDVLKVANEARDGLNGSATKAGLSVVSGSVDAVAAALNMNGDSLTGWKAPEYDVNGGKFTNVQAALAALDSKTGASASTNDANVTKIATALGMTGTVAGGLGDPTYTVAGINGGADAKPTTIQGAISAIDSNIASVNANVKAAVDGINGTPGKAGISENVATIAAALNMKGNAATGWIAPEYNVSGEKFANVQSALAKLDSKVGTGGGSDNLGGLFAGNKDTNMLDASATGSNSIALGGNASAGADSATALGSSAAATGSSSTAIGENANAEGMLSTAIGSYSNARASKSLAMGMEAKAYGGSSIALGSNSKALNMSDIAIGNATASGNYSFALGDSAESTKIDTLAMGHVAKSTGDKAIAIGSYTAASGVNTVALGAGAKATADNSVALGSDSITSSTNSISVGRAESAPGKKDQILRTIENVANGTKATDVATFGQLKEVKDSVAAGGTLGVAYTDDQFGTIVLKSRIGDPIAGATITNLKAGVNKTDAVNKGQLDDALDGIPGQAGIKTNVNKIAAALNMKGDAVNGWTAPEYSVNGGTFADVQTALTELDNKVGTGGSGIAYDNNAFASVTFAGKANGTTLKNVAAGIEDKDATNVSQLKVLAEAMGGGVDAQGAVTTKTYNVSGKDNLNLASAMEVLLKDAAFVDAVVYDRANNRVMLNGRAGAGGTLVTNVANGAINATSLDAVNGSQMFDVQTQVTNITNVINGADPKGFIQQSVDKTLTIGKDVAGTALNISGISGDRTISGVKEGVLDNDAATVGQVKKIVGSAGGSIAANGKDGKPGKDAIASGNGSTSIGKDSIASGDNSVAIGNGSIADRPNTLSVGAIGNERIISNVAPGVLGTDAVNVNQLNSGLSALDQKLSKDIQAVRKDVIENRKAASGGIASAMAMSTLPQAYTPGASLASAAVGGYGDRSALAIGISTISRDGKWIFNAKGSANTAGKVGGAIGIGYQW